MSDAARTVLFVPVSGPRGVGEYMRSRMVAEALAARRPSWRIHFVISEAAPYSSECPFVRHLTRRSPTLETARVNGIIDELSPDVVVFDASGASGQVRHAAKIGARTVFIAQYRRKVRKSLSFKRLPYLTERWIVEPSCVDGGLTAWDRFKLRAFGAPEPLRLGPMLPPPEPMELPETHHAGFWIATAGGGAQRIGERNASEVFLELAEQIHAESGLPAVVVMGPSYPKARLPESAVGNLVLGEVLPREMVWLRGQARAALTGAGSSSIIQTVALATPSVSVCLAHDQLPRIRAFEREGLTRHAKNTGRIVPAMLDLIATRERLDSQHVRRLLGPPGVQTAVERLVLLAEGGSRQDAA